MTTTASDTGTQEPQQAATAPPGRAVIIRQMQEEEAAWVSAATIIRDTALAKFMRTPNMCGPGFSDWMQSTGLPWNRGRYDLYRDTGRSQVSLAQQPEIKPPAYEGSKIPLRLMSEAGLRAEAELRHQALDAAMTRLRSQVIYACDTGWIRPAARDKALAAAGLRPVMTRQVVMTSVSASIVMGPEQQPLSGAEIISINDDLRALLERHRVPGAESILSINVSSYAETKAI